MNVARNCWSSMKCLIMMNGRAHACIIYLAHGGAWCESGHVLFFIASKERYGDENDRQCDQCRTADFQIWASRNQHIMRKSVASTHTTCWFAANVLTRSSSSSLLAKNWFDRHGGTNYCQQHRYVVLLVNQTNLISVWYKLARLHCTIYDICHCLFLWKICGKKVQNHVEMIFWLKCSLISLLYGNGNW